MPVTTHLKSLQALEMAIREGSLKAAAERLGITPAAVGQRIRSIEAYLGRDLLLRGRSGLRPTHELEAALGDLRAAFAALDRVTETLDFQRSSEIHLVCDRDWTELWLMPRLPAFREAHPNVLFCINGDGDVPMRLGAPDCRIERSADAGGEPLFTDLHVPLCSHDNLRRIADWDPVMQMEGMPLLHIEGRAPGWPEWFAVYGQRATGMDRGVHYRNARLALEAMRQDVGFVICGYALVKADLKEGRAVLPFGTGAHLPAPAPYRLRMRDGAEVRPQLARFADWLRAEAAATARDLDAVRSGAAA